MEAISNAFFWIPTPQCTQKTRAGVYIDIVLDKYPLYCSKCKSKTHTVDVKLKMVISK